MAARHFPAFSAALAAALTLGCAGCIVAPPPPPPAMVLPQQQQAAAPPATCREFRQTITVGGTQQQGYGTTCLQPDGTWRIMAAPNAQQPPPPPPVAAMPAYPYPYYYPEYYGPPVFGSIFVHGRFR